MQGSAQRAVVYCTIIIPRLKSCSKNYQAMGDDLYFSTSRVLKESNKLIEVNIVLVYIIWSLIYTKSYHPLIQPLL